jgi:hypothetical protein
VDGPSNSIVGLNGMSIARDGTGGIAYLEYVNGVQHVVVSRLVGGVFRAPEQVDTSLGGGSSQPVIAASSGGLLVVAFIHSGSLYAVSRPSSAKGWSQPQFLAGGASNPSLQANDSGKAYLAFTAAGAGGSNVRSAYYYREQWGVESASLNATPGDDAGTGAGRPKVATAGDSIATVAWGERGHIYTRRVWTTSPSVVYQQADAASVGGFGEVSSDSPDVAAGGNSSWVGVVFNETLRNGAQQQTRVFYNRLQGSMFNGITAADGSANPGEGAGDPHIAMAEYGNGLITSGRQTSNQVFTSILLDNGSFAQVYRADSQPNATAPHAVPGVAGLRSLVLAWQHDPGVLGAPDVRARFFVVATGFAPEQVLSTPAWGPTAAASGIAAGGDLNGDVAVAWVQGTPGSQRIVVAQMYQPPDKPESLSKYARSTRARLSWQPPEGSWGPMRYTVRVDGRFAGSTTATSITVPFRVSKGEHSWSLTATNPAGQQSPLTKSRLLIDTTPPRLSFNVTPGRSVGVNLRYTDTPPGAVSGVGSVVIRWGDGKSSVVPVGQRWRFHFYARRGRYRVTVIVTDRAQNQTRQTQQVTAG